MKILVIGDIHGYSSWKSMIKGDEDLVVFIGDYFDNKEGPNGGEQIQNFLEILKLKTQNLKKFVLLMGNHEYHYLNGICDRYSGYQNNPGINIVVNEAFDSGLLQWAYGVESYLFTHAGLTHRWAELHLSLDAEPTCEEIAEQINSANIHAFEAVDEYGFEIKSSPIWVRPKSMILDGFSKVHHIVGHTHQEKVTTQKTINEGFLTIIDCGEKGFYTINL